MMLLACKNYKDIFKNISPLCSWTLQVSSREQFCTISRLHFSRLAEDEWRCIVKPYDYLSWPPWYDFFESIVDVAACAGGWSLEEYILPLMVQALSGTAYLSSDYCCINFFCRRGGIRCCQGLVGSDQPLWIRSISGNVDLGTDECNFEIYLSSKYLDWTRWARGVWLIFMLSC